VGPTLKKGKKMQTESARMNSSVEARFRIQDPNSRPRVIKVIALDAASEGVLRLVATHQWQNATFLSAADFPGTALDFSGQPKDLTKEVDAADLVVMVAAPGGEAHAASVIGEACSARRVMTTCLVVGANRTSEEAVSKTLSQLRPWSLMLVVADPDEYIAGMLAALRA
jgi:hypothetical protein